MIRRIAARALRHLAEGVKMNSQGSAVLMRAARTVYTVARCLIALGVNPAGAQPDETTSHKGGEVTIITGPQKNTVQMRSTRFR